MDTQSYRKHTSKVYSEIFKDVLDGVTMDEEKKLLLIFDRFSTAAKEFMSSNIPVVGIRLREAVGNDMEVLFEIDNICFGAPEAEEANSEEENSEVENSEVENIHSATYIAELNGTIIGKIDTIMEGIDGYIYGFCLLPEYRGHGYGKELAYLMLQEFLQKNMDSVLLEVAMENTSAVELYRSCGFTEITLDNLSYYFEM